MPTATANDTAILLRRVLRLFREQIRQCGHGKEKELLDQIAILSETALGIVDILCPDAPVRPLTAAELRLFELLGDPLENAHG